MRNKKLYIILLENQTSALFVLFLIYIFSPYFNIWYGLLIAEIFANTIGIIYFLLYRFLNLFVKIEIKSLKRIINGLIFLFSVFSGIFVSEFILTNLLSFNILPSYKQLFLIANISIIFLILSMILIYKRLKIQIEENEKLKREKINAELSALRSKLNPHFLFNTLNVLLEIGNENYEEMEKIIINLSHIYRKILHSSDKDLIYFREEFELIKDYLEIEKIRLGERLKCEFNIEKSVLDFKIPMLILEPIVENSIIHGISKKKDGGEIKISAIQKDTEIEFLIEDTGIGKIEDIKYGFGLTSIKNRLELVYKDKAKLLIEQNQPTGIKTRIIIRG